MRTKADRLYDERRNLLADIAFCEANKDRYSETTMETRREQLAEVEKQMAELDRRDLSRWMNAALDVVTRDRVIK